MRAGRDLSVAIAVFLVASGAYAQARGLTVSAGFDTAAERYGLGVDAQSLRYPAAAGWVAGAPSLKLGLSQLRFTDPGQPAAPPVSWINPSGVGLGEPARAGNLLASGAWNVYDRSGLGLDLTAKVMLRAPDETTGFGIAPNDFAIQGDLVKNSQRFASFATLGWRKAGGEVPGYDYRNPWYAVLGGTYKLSDGTTGGLSYDWRQRTLAGNPPLSELSAFVSHSLGQGLKLQGYVVWGFATPTPDWGAGASLQLGF